MDLRFRVSLFFYFFKGKALGLRVPGITGFRV